MHLKKKKQNRSDKMMKRKLKMRKMEGREALHPKKRKGKKKNELNC